MPLDKNLESIYIRAANLIYDLNFRCRISEEEKVFLLNLLETTIYKKDKNRLIEVLKRWMAGYDSSELDQIIKETLLAVDWSDEKSLAFNTEIIDDLLDAREDTVEGPDKTGGRKLE